MELSKRIAELEQVIISAYEGGVTMPEAEKLAAAFLAAQLQVSSVLAEKDLDARMRKSGLKAIKAGAYSAAISASEKKPTEAQLEHTLNSDTLVLQSQEDLDRAEVTRDELERAYNIFREAHVYFRGVAKGRFE